jgi:CHAD domain-containing protein
MMTTERTAIRRRLSIRRTAHRPPWSGRKIGHRSIVAPFAATVAATVAVGVGVALARAERERRATREHRSRESHFGLLAGERLGEGLRRIALEQLDLTIALLQGGAGEGSAERAVHEMRKSLKRLRALMRLLEDELGEQAFARESALLRDAGVRLAQARDAEVLVKTLDELLKRHPRKLVRRRGVQRLRARLQRERDGAAQLALTESATRAGVLDDLRGLRGRVADWQLADPGGIEAVEPALKRLYREGMQRRRKAKRASGERARTRTMHEWRKRVKDLRYAAEMLDRARPDPATRAADGKSKERPRKGGGRSAGADHLRRVAQQADDLGELLGEEHDLAQLATRVRAEAKAGRASGAPGAGTRGILLKLIARRRKRLRARALRDGKRLYGRAPGKFLRRARAAAALGAVSRR